MQMVKLGATGVDVSALCYGTMSFGAEADAAESARLFAACRDAGINFFDCANVYSRGRAEEILGGLIAGSRDELVITSKCVMGPDGVANGRGASRRHIALAVEASLRRLGTDRLDVLFTHRFDEATRLEDTMRALEDLVRAGKVLYLGASNYAAWQVMKANGIAERAGSTRFDLLQPMYNLVKRQAEVELLPMAEAERIAVTPYSPVGGGLLSGKYRAADAEGRLKANARYGLRYGQAWMGETATAFADFAEARGWHPVSLAVAWCGGHAAVTAPIVGARDVAQLQPALASTEIAMTPELRAEISALSQDPPPATDRIEERA